MDFVLSEPIEGQCEGNAKTEIAVSEFLLGDCSPVYLQLGHEVVCSALHFDAL